MIILTSILTICFLCLAILHFHWAIGGTWGLSNALPTKADGQKVIKPSRFATLIIAAGLLFFAFFYFINPEENNPKNWIFDYGRIIIPLIFLLRVIGDFKYVGLFKKEKGSAFAKMDSKYYTPISAAIAGLGLIVKLFG